MRIIVISVLALLLGVGCKRSATSQSTAKRPADSLSVYLYSTLPALMNSDKLTEAKALLDSLWPIFEAGDNIALKCAYFVLRGNYFLALENSDSARFYYDACIRLALQKDTTRKAVIRGFFAKANFFRQESKLDSAMLMAKEAYRLAKESKDSNIMAHTAERVAEVYAAMPDMQMAHLYLLEALRYTNDPAIKYTLLDNLFDYYVTTRKFDSAERFFDERLLPDTPRMSPLDKAFVFNNYGEMKAEQHEFGTALDYYAMSKHYYLSQGQPVTVSFYNMARASAGLKLYDKANRYLDSGLVIATAGKDFYDQFLLIREKASLCRLLGKGDLSYRLMDSAIDLKQQYFDSSSIGKARELEIKYAVKDKDNQIRLLGVTGEAARRETRQQRILIVILGLATVLVIILAVVLFHRRSLANQLAEIELKQQLLRAQMEPHFIFNTLSVLQGQIRNGENERAGLYLNIFARLLRQSLDNSREPYVPLHDEIASLENYLVLQALRFQGLFDYELVTDEDYEEEQIFIPPMLFQPFVENAILHGLQSIREKGHIKISFAKSGRAIACNIQDNGRGMETSESLEPGSKSLAIKIVRKRLDLLARQTRIKSQLTITSGPEAGTLVILIVPFKTLDQMQWKKKQA